MAWQAGRGVHRGGGQVSAQRAARSGSGSEGDRTLLRRGRELHETPGREDQLRQASDKPLRYDTIAA